MTSARSTNPHKIRTKLVRVISLSFVLFRGSCLVVPLTNLKDKGRFVIFQQPARRRSLSGQSVLKQTVKRRQRFDMTVLLNLDNPRANRFGPRVRVIGRFKLRFDLGSFWFALLDWVELLRGHLF